MRALAFALLFFVTGCAALSGSAGRSFTHPAYPPEALESVATDLANQLVGAYPPGRVTLCLAGEKGGAGALGAALEDALRLRGFSLAQSDLEANVTVTYVFDRLGEGTWYARLSATDGLLVTRAWSQGPAGLTPGAVAQKVGQ